MILQLPLQSVRLLQLLALSLFAFGCAHLPPEKNADRPFQFKTDRLGFSNETVWNYVNGEIKSERDHHQATGERYTRRCFVVSRSVVQFWKFARFDASLPPLDDATLAHRIRAVTTLDVWRPPLDQKARILFPGYPNLHAISKAHPKIFQANLGLGWPVYCRIGNMPLIIPPTRDYQKNLHQQILADLQKGYPTILWMANFPKLDINHAVTAFALVRKNKKETVFSIYDPNDCEAPKELTYDEASQSFTFQKTFYFKGGPVNLRPLYRSPIQ